MAPEPRGLVDRLVSACVALLAGAIALYVAARLLQAIWPVLVTLLVSVVGVVVGYRIWRSRTNRW